MSNSERVAILRRLFADVGVSGVFGREVREMTGGRRVLRNMDPPDCAGREEATARLERRREESVAASDCLWCGILTVKPDTGRFRLCEDFLLSEEDVCVVVVVAVVVAVVFEEDEPVGEARSSAVDESGSRSGYSFVKSFRAMSTSVGRIRLCAGIRSGRLKRGWCEMSKLRLCGG